MPSVSVSEEEALVTSLSESYEAITKGIRSLNKATEEILKLSDIQTAADLCHDKVLAVMEELRLAANAAEMKIPDEYLPYPTYDQLLFSV